MNKDLNKMDSPTEYPKIGIFGLGIMGGAIAKNLVEKGNPNSISDVDVASEAALGGLRGAAMNVLINLKGIDDKIYAKKTVKDIQILIKKAESLHKKIFNKSINTINK